jgi:hypothetical protein
MRLIDIEHGLQALSRGHHFGDRHDTRYPFAPREPRARNCCRLERMRWPATAVAARAWAWPRRSATPGATPRCGWRGDNAATDRRAKRAAQPRRRRCPLSATITGRRVSRRCACCRLVLDQWFLGLAGRSTCVDTRPVGSASPRLGLDAAALGARGSGVAFDAWPLGPAMTRRCEVSRNAVGGASPRLKKERTTHHQTTYWQTRASP